jgi:hypothetical protein
LIAIGEVSGGGTSTEALSWNSFISHECVVGTGVEAGLLIREEIGVSGTCCYTLEESIVGIHESGDGTVTKIA